MRRQHLEELKRAASRLRVSPKELRLMVNEGDLRSCLINGRVWIDREELERRVRRTYRGR